jgi:hypothetical protein
MGIPWNRRFVPGLSSIFTSVGAIYAWASVISLKKLFSTRKRFEAYTELHQGTQLTEALYGDPGLMQSVNNKVTKIRKGFVFQLILTGIMLLVAASLKIPLPLTLYLLLIVILISGICIIGFFGIVKREHYHAGEGIALSALNRFKHITGIGIFATLSITAAIVISSNTAILPASLIAGFFRWLFSLFSRPDREVPFEMPPIPQIMSPMDFEQAFPDIDVEPREPWPIWQWLKYGIIALAAAGFILFMISPLLNRGKGSEGKLTFRRRLYRIIAELFKGIASAFSSFSDFIRHGKAGRRLRKPGSAEIRRMAENVLGAYSQTKNKDMRLSITLFARLIIWGGEVRHVEWKPSFAPGEYCTLLAAAPPATVTSPATPPATADPSALKRQNEGIIRCGELFEQALYSEEVLSKAERNEFKDMVELVVSG